MTRKTAVPDGEADEDDAIATGLCRAIEDMKPFHEMEPGHQDYLARPVSKAAEWYRMEGMDHQ